MTSQYDKNAVTATSRVYRVVFADGQVLDFVVEVRRASLFADGLLDVDSKYLKI